MKLTGPPLAEGRPHGAGTGIPARPGHPQPYPAASPRPDAVVAATARTRFRAGPGMSGGTVIDRTSPTPAYQQVADALAARITAGRYPGKLPPERDLAVEFGVSYVTVRHAMTVLRQRGLIETAHGRGTFPASAPAAKTP